MPMRRKLMKEGGFRNIDNIENLACNNPTNHSFVLSFEASWLTVCLLATHSGERHSADSKGLRGGAEECEQIGEQRGSRKFREMDERVRISLNERERASKHSG